MLNKGPKIFIKFKFPCPPVKEDRGPWPPNVRQFFVFQKDFRTKWPTSHVVQMQKAFSFRDPDQRLCPWTCTARATRARYRLALRAQCSRKYWPWMHLCRTLSLQWIIATNSIRCFESPLLIRVDGLWYRVLLTVCQNIDLLHITCKVNDVGKVADSILAYHRCTWHRVT